MIKHEQDEGQREVNDLTAQQCEKRLSAAAGTHCGREVLLLLDAADGQQCEEAQKTPQQQVQLQEQETEYDLDQYVRGSPRYVRIGTCSTCSSWNVGPQTE